jgi:type II secretory pathway component PulF
MQHPTHTHPHAKPRPAREQTPRLWHWQAQDASGHVHSGELMAADAGAAKLALQRQGFYSATLRTEALSVSAPRGDRQGIANTSAVGHARLSSKQVLWLTQQVAFLCKAGLPLLEALTLLQQQALAKPLAYVVQQLVQGLSAGVSLADAFAEQPHNFSRAYVGSLQAASGSGLLGEVFDSLSAQLQFKADMQAQLRSALSYPLLLVGFSIVIVVGLLLFVVPTFELQFANQGLTLPWPTRFLLNASHALGDYAGYAGAAMVLAALALRRWIQPNRTHPSARYLAWQLRVHHWPLTLPVLGPWLWRMAAAQWAHTCAQLLGTGLPLLSALTHAQQAQPNVYVAAQLGHVQHHIEQGHSLSQALTETTLFDANLWAVCAVGEATGDMGRALAHVATMLQTQCSQQLKLFTSLLEPVAVVVVGGLIGAIVLAMYWPIFELGRTV